MSDVDGVLGRKKICGKRLNKVIEFEGHRTASSVVIESVILNEIVTSRSV